MQYLKYNILIQKYRIALIGVMLAWTLGVMTYWSGLPSGDKLPNFILGAAIYIGLLILFGFLVWWLMFRPMPNSAEISTNIITFSIMLRRGVALGLLLATFVITVDGAWDEVWHRQYGVPFGEDLFWRPHLLMYFGFMIVMGLSAIAFLLIWRRGQGPIAHRLRKMPHIAWLVIMGALFAFVLPADPVWHVIYGDDISAWSIPHFMLTVGSFSIAIVAVSWMLSTVAPRDWQTRMPLTWGDFFVIMVVIASTSGGYQVLLTEWDALNHSTVAAFMAANNRPEWILPVMLIGIAGIIGGMVNHALRRWGAATLFGFLSLALRVFLLQSFDYNGMTANAWVVAIPPLVALDLVYAWCLRDGKLPTLWQGSLAMTIGTLLVMVPLINLIYSYPHFADVELLPVAFYGMLVGMPALWVGRIAGDYLGVENKQLEAATTLPLNIRVAIPAELAIAIAFIIFFVATANPPI